MKRIVVYTTDPCPYCVGAKQLLAKYDADYDEINLARDPVGRAELAERTGLMTFPQIVIDGVTLGGMDALQAAERAGRLPALLTGAEAA